MEGIAKKDSCLNKKIIKEIPLLEKVLDEITITLSNNKKVGFIYIDLANSGYIRNTYGDFICGELLRNVIGILGQLYSESILMEDDILAIDSMNKDCFFIFLIPSSRYIFAMQDLRLTLQRILHRLNESVNEFALSHGVRDKIEFYSGVNFIYPDPLIGTFKLIHEAHKEAVLNCRVQNFVLRFINNISHELSTPLTCIKGYVETLMDGAMKDQETCLHFLNIINFETNRLTSLISSLLELSFIQGGFVEMNFQILYIDKLIRKSISLMKSFAQKKGVNINFSCPDLSYRVRVDGDRIVQVLIHILDNAIRYSPEYSEVEVAIKLQDEYVRIEISDEGPGIPTKNIKRIFEIFERNDEDRSLKKGGTGLGLAIAKSIIKLHGGIIGVDSEMGKGSTFYFLLLKVT